MIFLVIIVSKFADVCDTRAREFIQYEMVLSERCIIVQTCGVVEDSLVMDGGGKDTNIRP